MAAKVLILAALPLLVLAAPASNTKADPERQPDFDAQRYLGRWFEIARSKYMPFEVGTDNEANYALNPNGSIAVRNLEWRTTYWSEARALAEIVDNARLTVDFFLGTPPGDYQVLKTDYDTYAVVYSDAGNLGQIRVQYGWILARETSLPADLLNELFGIFEQRVGLKRSSFLLTQHGVAPYPPPAGSPRNEAEIPLQADFNLTAYTGLWYEIYRTNNIPFTFGTDTTSQYTVIRDNYVGIIEKDWKPVDEKWDVTQAVGTYVSNARLTVRFYPYQPSRDYLVLYTDYENVASVYAQIGNGPYATKYGWVLARNTSPTAEQTDKAFAVFEEAAGLSRRLFVETKHGIAPAEI